MLTIAVEGIPREHMTAGFGLHLRKHFGNIVDIYEHVNTEKEDYQGQTIGRWNLMSKTEDFNKTASAMNQSVFSICQKQQAARHSGTKLSSESN